MNFGGFSSWADWAPLANHVWQSTVCVGFAWVLMLALRKNRAAVRYWIWFAASVKFLVPFAPLVALGGKFAWRTAPVMAQPQIAFLVDNFTQPFAAAPAAIPAVAAHISVSIPQILFFVWISGILAGVAFWLRCWRTMRAVRRSATPLALGLPIPAMSSASQIEPGVFGIFRPVLLLPEGIAERLTPAQLDPILSHEMCHVRRRDNLTAAIHMIVETVFWFYPLSWWLRARLVEERERACDEEVLRLGGEAEVYAEGILAVCKIYAEAPMECVSGISGSDLKRRIVRIAERHLGDRLTHGRKLLLAAAAIAAVACPLLLGVANAPVAQAQSSAADWEKVAGGKMTFDVASVKRNMSGFPDGDRPSMDTSMDDSEGYKPTGGLFSARNIPLALYIGFAYKLDVGSRPNWPKWVTTEAFDIQARGPANATRDQMRLMMQALLADRFKLAVHDETQQVPTLLLVLAKPGKTGPQLQPHSEQPPCVTYVRGMTSSEQMATVPGGYPALCGRMLGTIGHDGAQMGARGMTMADLANYISSNGTMSFNRPVIDKTGLSGMFDLKLEYTVDTGGAQETPADFQASFIEALRDELGLKLEDATGPVGAFVVDHIEEPSAN
jgi:bla regulator protein BlaR1